MVDPPWQLSSVNPTRGVAIAYDTLLDKQISELPISSLCNEGLLFVWTINAKFSFTLKLIKTWGFKYIDQITWVKQTCKGNLAKGHG